MIPIAYDPDETVQDLRLRLEQLTKYPADTQQLIYDGAAVTDTTPIQALAQGPAILKLSRTDKPPSEPLDHVLSRHSYRSIEAEETAEQYLGKIGLVSRGNTFGSHTYDDVKGKGEALQVLGEMASFRPRFGSRGKDKSVSQS
jgi:hypothetical protein